MMVLIGKCHGVFQKEVTNFDTKLRVWNSATWKTRKADKKNLYNLLGDLEDSVDYGDNFHPDMTWKPSTSKANGDIGKWVTDPVCEKGSSLCIYFTNLYVIGKYHRFAGVRFQVNRLRKEFIVLYY
ncbi:hypothetical protein Lser_V15G14762 [Lactuca serriola]